MNSSRHLQEFKVFIDGLNPIKLVYNARCIFYDNEDFMTPEECQKGYTVWNRIMTANPIITSISINIVDFHHSEIYLTGDYYEQ